MRGLSYAMTMRPIDANWRCQLSGDCCRLPQAVVMTPQEWALLKSSPAARTRQLVYAEKDGWIALRAKPCPFFTEAQGCSVYEIRPTNCRRFACMRPDPKTEPLELHGPMGCANLYERVRSSRMIRRLYQQIQRKAQRWGLKHGWAPARS